MGRVLKLLPPEYKRQPRPAVRLSVKAVNPAATKTINLPPGLRFFLLATLLFIFMASLVPINFFAALSQELAPDLEFKDVINEIGLLPIILPPSLLPLSLDSEKRIEMSLFRQHLTLFRDGQPIVQYRISSGKRSTPTKIGNFSVISKYDIAYGGIKGERWVMPYFLGIYEAAGQENGIHELPFINGWREGARSLGRPVSHGCVRLDIGEAEKVYRFAEIGTPVKIYY